MTEVESVLAANEIFYRVFEARDLRAMATLWAQTRDAVCIHPGWEVVRGYRAVMQSWSSIFTTGLAMRFRITDLSVHVEGDLARVHNVENIYVGGDENPLGRVAVTHLFVRRGEGWALVLHHGSPIAAEDTPAAEPEPTEFH